MLGCKLTLVPLFACIVGCIIRSVLAYHLICQHDKLPLVISSYCIVCFRDNLSSTNIHPSRFQGPGCTCLELDDIMAKKVILSCAPMKKAGSQCNYVTFVFIKKS